MSSDLINILHHTSWHRIQRHLIGWNAINTLFTDVNLPPNDRYCCFHGVNFHAFSITPLRAKFSAYTQSQTGGRELLNLAIYDISQHINITVNIQRKIELLALLIFTASKGNRTTLKCSTCSLSASHINKVSSA